MLLSLLESIGTLTRLKHAARTVPAIQSHPAFGDELGGGVSLSAAAAEDNRLGTFLNDGGNRDGFCAMLLGLFVGATYAPGWLPALLAVVTAGTQASWVGRLV
jgi:hypothetical protein